MIVVSLSRRDYLFGSSEFISELYISVLTLMGLTDQYIMRFHPITAHFAYLSQQLQVEGL